MTSSASVTLRQIAIPNRFAFVSATGFSLRQTRTGLALDTSRTSTQCSTVSSTRKSSSSAAASFPREPRARSRPAREAPSDEPALGLALYGVPARSRPLGHEERLPAVPRPLVMPAITSGQRISFGQKLSVIESRPDPALQAADIRARRLIGLGQGQKWRSPVPRGGSRMGVRGILPRRPREPRRACGSYPPGADSPHLGGSPRGARCPAGTSSKAYQPRCPASAD